MENRFEYRDESLYCHHTVDLIPDPVEFSMHTHEQMEIFYFISGNGSYIVEGIEYPLSPYDLMIMRSAEAHKLKIQSDTPYERIAIHFSSNLFEYIDPHHRLLRPFLNRPLGQHNHYSAADYPNAYWHTAFSFFDFSDSLEIQAHLLSRILGILSELCDRFDQRSGLEPSPQDFPAKLVAYVNEHLYTDISLKSIATVFYLSTTQINRIFQRATGSSLWEYVLLKRLLAARARLQRGESAGKTSVACGFKDYSTFFKAYKAHFGCAPTTDIPRKGLQSQGTSTKK